jgi:predicted RNase H-like HicB family nuclease
MNKAQTYPTQVYWDERDSGYIAIAPDLPGCSSFGETQGEALKELEHAIEGWIAAALAAGESVPAPSLISAPSAYSGKTLLRMPASLHRRLAQEAEAEGVSLNQWLVSVLSASSAVYARADAVRRFGKVAKVG